MSTDVAPIEAVDRGTILVTMRCSKHVPHAGKRILAVLFIGMMPLVLTGQALGDDAEVVFPEPPVPEISEVHRRFLSRVAERTLRDAAMERGRYQPRYVPEALESMEVEAVVRVRQRGYLLYSGQGGPAPVATAVRDAANHAAKGLDATDYLDPTRMHDWLLEIEVVGGAVPLPVKGDWTKPSVIEPAVEPGVDGIVIISLRDKYRFCPSELYTNDLPPADALERVAQRAHDASTEVATSRLLRFRSAHWYAEMGNEDVVSLTRGMTVLPPAIVNRAQLDKAIDRLAAYMVYRQLDSGLFTYQYEPGANRYSDDDSIIRQVGASAAICRHARWAGKAASRAAADKAIRHHLQALKPIPQVENGAYIATDDGAHPLGVTAMFALALAAHDDRDRYADQREQLINGMLWLQRPSGMFITAFPPAQDVEAQHHFPGEALLALASDYEIDPEGRILDAFDRALTYYRDFFTKQREPMFVPWQARAYGIMARVTQRDDYKEFVFEMADWLVAHQLNDENCEFPELWGGIATLVRGRPDVSTAMYLSALCEALRLARSADDKARVERYESAIRAGARFVMQLQVRPEETYFMRSPTDAIGGIRMAPALNLMRISNCQHAMTGLIEARRVLYEDRG